MKYEKGTFMWAVEQLKAGKKVTSKKLNVPYLDLGFDGICNHKAVRYHTDIELFEATDWEVVEEKKSLYDKFKADGQHSRSFLAEDTVCFEDVKQALKEFMKEMTDFPIPHGDRFVKIDKIIEEAKKHFGKELIE